MSQKKKVILHPTGRAKIKSEGVPLIVIYWAGGLGLLSYIVSRFVLTEHPLHWASAIGGLALGIAIGTIWYFVRGDVGLI